ncbi:MAG: hypothetical protein ACLFNT_04105 [Spirochaetales bacterium]
MSTNVLEQVADGLIRLERDGETFLGVNTGIPTNSPTLRKLAGRKRQPGLLIRDGKVDEWEAKGFVEHDGRIHVYGPLVEGRLLESELHDEKRPRFASLRRLAEAFSVLQQLEYYIPTIHTRSIVLTDDGGILFLPPDAMQAIREHQTYRDRIESMERYNHPDRSANENLSFFLAAASYFVITGRFPFDADDEEELHARVRAKTVLPPQAIDVTISERANSMLERALTSSEQEVSLAEWISALQAWETEGVTEEISEEERQKRLESAQQRTQRVERGFRRKEGLRKNGRAALLIAAVVVIVGSIPATIISNALQPRETAGFEPREVVEAFYGSFATLNHMLMEDTLIGDAGAQYVRELTNLFVIDRQRMGVEGQSGFVDAQLWRDQGMPRLDNSRSPYGIANLTLEEIGAPEGERAFVAEFERWRPDYEGAEVGRTGPLGLREVDRLALRQDDEDWVIYEIENLESEPIDVQELRQSQDSD